MSSMAARIRKARTLAALSQSELARRVAVERSAVTQWESLNGTTPSLEHLIQVALEAGVYFEWLATGRGPSGSVGREFVTAIVMQDFAHDEVESRALDLLRRLSPKKRQLACSILELLSQ